MPSSCYMDADVAGKSVDQTKYRGLIGSLLYLTTSRPDIMFAVCLCARYQANPKESHFKAAKRILKYLKGTSSVGLWYPSHSLILPVDQSARVLPRRRYLSLDRLCTTLASVSHTSILLKNLKKTEWRRCGRSRSDAQVSDGITKNSKREKLKLKEPCKISLSVL